MNFKFPSITRMLKGAEAAVSRFPLAALAALAGTIIGIVLLHADEPSFYPNALMMLALAFPLLVAIVLLGERQSWTLGRKAIVNGAGIVFLIIYYLLLPDNIFQAEEAFFIRYVMWATGFVLLITFVSFLKRNEEKSVIAFWHYNRILFFSLALTALWALAIQAGLSIAMASVDFLFNIDIDGDRYVELWIVVV